MVQYRSAFSPWEDPLALWNWLLSNRNRIQQELTNEVEHQVNLHQTSSCKVHIDHFSMLRRSTLSRRMRSYHDTLLRYVPASLYYSLHEGMFCAICQVLLPNLHPIFAFWFWSCQSDAHSSQSRRRQLLSKTFEITRHHKGLSIGSGKGEVVAVVRDVRALFEAFNFIDDWFCS